MKKFLAAAVAAALACSTVWAEYEEDMAKKWDSQSVVEWQNANGAALAEAVKPDVLADFAHDAQSAAALLACVKPAYATDPLKACQVAAVTQYVMEEGSFWDGILPWRQTRAEKRDVWTAALLDAAKKSKDEYVAVFMLDQLRWCGKSCQADAVRALAADRDARTREFAAVVADELRGALLPR